MRIKFLMNGTILLLFGAFSGHFSGFSTVLFSQRGLSSNTFPPDKPTQMVAKSCAFPWPSSSFFLPSEGARKCFRHEEYEACFSQKNRVPSPCCRHSKYGEAPRPKVSLKSAHLNGMECFLEVPYTGRKVPSSHRKTAKDRSSQGALSARHPTTPT